MRGGKIVGGFVHQIGGVRQDDKAVGKARGHPKLFVVVFGQLHPSPLAKGWRGFAEVYRHVKNGAIHHAYQLALGLLQLLAQAAQLALGAAAVVGLHKVHIQTSDPVEVLLVETLKKDPPRIAKDLGLEDEQVGDVGGGDGVGHGLDQWLWLI